MRFEDASQLTPGKTRVQILQQTLCLLCCFPEIGLARCAQSACVVATKFTWTPTAHNALLAVNALFHAVLQ